MYHFILIVAALSALSDAVEARAGWNAAFVTPIRASRTSASSTCNKSKNSNIKETATILSLSDWSNFEYLDDDVDGLPPIDNTDYALEEDSQDEKARVGSSLEAPEIENDAEPIFVPTGSQLELDEATVMGVVSACRQEIGTMFGYTAENRGVGITGGVDFVEMDGPVVVLRLKGRYWHQRTTVLDRVATYLQQRIPEIIDVTIEDEWQLTDEANEAAA